MEQARAHLFIDGRVQGVFFRGFTRDLASSLGLGGWVKNLHDGRVEAVFEGALDTVEQAIRECRKGPPSADVTDVDVKWEEYSGGSGGFEIRH
jgi:acylphosphatase